MQKEQQLALQMTHLETLPLPADIDYAQLTSLSIEAREKLNKFRPATIGAAARISGVSQANVAVLMIYTRRI